MSNAKHQAAWRSRLREQGWHPVTLWLPPLTLSRLSQVCEYTKASRAFTLRHAIDFALLSSRRARDDYWQMVRQSWENRERKDQ